MRPLEPGWAVCCGISQLHCGGEISTMTSDSGFTHHNIQLQLLTAGNSAKAMPIFGSCILLAETYKMEHVGPTKNEFSAMLSQ